MLQPNQYLIGNATVLSVVISKDNVHADPDVVQLLVESPTGVTSTYTYGSGSVIVKTAVGMYKANIDLLTAGVWKYRWQTAAPDTGAVESEFFVNESIL